MWFEQFLNQRMQILNYVKQGYLHHRLENPGDAKLCEQVFLALPKAHQVKYTKKHHLVKDDILKLQEFFEGHCLQWQIQESCQRQKEFQGTVKTKKSAHCNNQDNHSSQFDSQDHYDYWPHN